MFTRIAQNIVSVPWRCHWHHRFVNVDESLTLAGVEVGVDRGGYSAHILLHWTGRMLHLVDPWMAAGAYPAFREDHLEVSGCFMSMLILCAGERGWCGAANEGRGECPNLKLALKKH